MDYRKKSITIWIVAIGLVVFWGMGVSGETFYELEEIKVSTDDSLMSYLQMQGHPVQGVEEKINNQLQGMAEAIRERMDQGELYDVFSRASWQGEEFLSVVFTGIDRVHHETFTESVTFDLETGAVLEITDIIPHEIFLGEEFFEFINSWHRNVGKTNPFSMGPHVQYYFFRHPHSKLMSIELHFVRTEPIRTPVYIKGPVAPLMPYLDERISQRISDKL